MLHLSDHKTDAAATAEALSRAEGCTLIAIHESKRYLLFGDEAHVQSMSK